MEIQEKIDGATVILEPLGRLDTNTSGEFEEKLAETFAAGATQLIIDLIQVDYISSAGLRVLLMAAKKIKTLKGSLILCSMSDHIKEVFDIAGFTPVFTIHQTQADAIKSLQ